jgi:hypothetical protein
VSLKLPTYALFVGFTDIFLNIIQLYSWESSNSYFGVSSLPPSKEVNLLIDLPGYNDQEEFGADGANNCNFNSNYQNRTKFSIYFI